MREWLAESLALVATKRISERFRCSDGYTNLERVTAERKEREEGGGTKRLKHKRLRPVYVCYAVYY